MAKAGRGADQFMVRLPDGMRDQLKESAAANGRSMNAEIVARIETALSLTQQLKEAEADAELLKASVAELKQAIETTKAEFRDEISKSSKWHRDSMVVMRGLLSLINQDYGRLDDQQKSIVGDAIKLSFGMPLIDTDKAGQLSRISNIVGDFYFPNEGAKPLADGEKHDLSTFITKQMVELINPTLEYLKREGWKLTPPAKWPTDEEVQSFLND